MTWIPNVAPYDTIQSIWGNQIRDRVVMEFATIAERNSSIPAPHDGQVCWVIAESVLFVRFGNAWRVLDMDWRTFPGGAGQTLAAMSGAAVSDVDLTWKNQLGRCSALGSFTFGTGGQSPGGTMYLRAPVPSAKPGPMGSAHFHLPGNGNNYGGHAQWGGATGATSAAVIQNHGNGVPLYPSMPAGAIGPVLCYMNLSYMCDQTLYAAT